ncbi:Oidioi.mRNA.OKI2018_I69.chr2.g4466.t1.cds [Oikopleura dioica]|uniref:Oidioi.mRNA.OKI2018_I69.chr2.g4466.t1.cds n=1 Tax=Oikopleura dioica TaxID=34765 RepID=A0ABN7T0V6_OIKDI|nr:Oidioi.mRNA.OKI2018_I69.chr2.g4466.t1.cds [Oikopleura dioica]
MKFSIIFLSSILNLSRASVVQDKVDILLGHFDWFAENLPLQPGDKKDDRYVSKIQQYASQIVAANGGRGEVCNLRNRDSLLADVDAQCSWTNGMTPCQRHENVITCLFALADAYACDGRGNLAARIQRRWKRRKINLIIPRHCPFSTVLCPLGLCASG